MPAHSPGVSAGCPDPVTVPASIFDCRFLAPHLENTVRFVANALWIVGISALPY
jgi:hypothetical protein